MKGILNLIFTVIGICLIGCTLPPNQHNVNITNPILDTIISGFRKSLKANNIEEQKNITVGFTRKQDTVILSIGNSDPDLRISKYIGYISIEDTIISFVGDYNEKFYVCQKVGQIPKEIVEKNRKMFSPDSPPTFYDPILWQFKFKNDSLVDCYPIEEIRNFTKLNKKHSK